MSIYFVYPAPPAEVLAMEPIFALLYNKGLHGRDFQKDGQDFLKHDFLSYTLARMLGPDFFRPILPFDLKNMSDRAGALEKSMERELKIQFFCK